MNESYLKSIEKIFHANGTLADRLPDFEFRESQQEMALSVAEAIIHSHHLIAEAGTGTGKTLAYLIPAIFSGKKITVSTGTKNLQEQIHSKDLPLLEKLFPENNYSYLLMKGRGNYFCHRRHKLFKKQQQQQSLLPDYNEYHLNSINEWSLETETGDRSELEFLPDHSTIWDQINSRTDFCLQSFCREKNCFIALLKQKAYEADLLLVNHHLFLSDLLVKESGKGIILPETDAVIFDEAHLLEPIATDFFSAQISNIQFDILHRAILMFLEIEKLNMPEVIDTSVSQAPDKTIKTNDRILQSHL